MLSPRRSRSMEADARQTTSSEAVLQPELDLTHRHLQRGNSPKVRGEGGGRSDSRRRAAEGRVVGEVETFKAEGQTVALPNPEALVSGEVPILLGGTADHVTADVADHALRGDHDGGRVKPFPRSRVVELHRLAGGVRARAILQG